MKLSDKDRFFLLQRLFSQKGETPLFLVHHYDENLLNDIKTLKNRLRKKGNFVIETYQGELEKRVISGASGVVKEIIDYTAYAATILFDVTKVAGEVYGIWQAAFAFNKFIEKISFEKDMLLINEIERENNFPLQVCFIVNSRMSDHFRLKALNDIVATSNAVKDNILQYKNIEIMVLNYNIASQIWDLENPKFFLRNHGTVAITTQRTGKIFGFFLASDVFEGPYNNYWEYINNTDVSEKAKKNALMLRHSYYQKLRSVGDIRSALKTVGAAQVCVYMYDNFLSPLEGRVSLPAENAKYIGGHAVSVIGFDDEKKEFTFNNNWGENWGDKGRGYLPYEYVDKYLMEAWANSPLFNIKWRLKRLANPLRWPFQVKRFIKALKEKSLEKVVRKGRFIDKRRVSVKYEVKVVRSLNQKGYFYVINLFNTKESLAYGAWCHFNLDPRNNYVEIEELFVSEDFKGFGWGKFMINLVEEYARREKIEKVYGWVYIYDAFNELLANFLKRFYEKKGYQCINDTGAHVGSLFRFEKFL